MLSTIQILKSSVLTATPTQQSTQTQSCNVADEDLDIETAQSRLINLHAAALTEALS